MKIKTLNFLLIIAILLACNNTNENKGKTDSKQEEINKTPEVLEENVSNKLSSYSKRYDIDIISKLYDEAVEKNLKLKQLNDDIEKMPDLRHDSLEDYSKFSEINLNYWMAVNNYINDLQDTILKESTLKVFKALESSYKAKMFDHEQKLIAINEKNVILNDQLLLMKLLITQPMMKNYQINEKPGIKTLENIIDKYDQLIKETEAYTKIAK